MKILHNPRCRKSRETLQILQDKGWEVEVIEYLKDVPTEAELKTIVKKLGIEPIDLIRKGEQLYKENFKGKDLSPDQWIKVMIENPVLIERPIVIAGDRAVIGRPPESVLELL